MRGRALAVLAPLLFGACAQPTALNFANASASHVDLAGWIDRVNADAGGAIEIRLHGRDTPLGHNPSRQLAQLRDGSADLAVLLTGYYPRDFPDDDVSEIPFLFADAAQGSVVMWRLATRGLLRGYGDLEVIGAWTGSDRWLHLRDPLPDLAALRGRRIGAPGEFAAPIVATLGAEPVSLSAANAAGVIADGRLDGIFVGLRGLYEQRIVDVASHHIAAPLGRPFLVLAMTKTSFQALPPAARAALSKNSGEALSRRWGAAEQARHYARVDTLRATPGHTLRTLTPAEKKQWSEATQAGIQNWIAADPRRQRALDAARREAMMPREGR